MGRRVTGIAVVVLFAGVASACGGTGTPREGLPDGTGAAAFAAATLHLENSSRFLAQTPYETSATTPKAIADHLAEFRAALRTFDLTFIELDRRANRGRHRLERRGPRRLERAAAPVGRDAAPEPRPVPRSPTRRRCAPTSARSRRTSRSPGGRSRRWTPSSRPPMRSRRTSRHHRVREDRARRCRRPAGGEHRRCRGPLPRRDQDGGQRRAAARRGKTTPARASQAEGRPGGPEGARRVRPGGHLRSPPRASWSTPARRCWPTSRRRRSRRRRSPPAASTARCTSLREILTRVRLLPG